MKDINWLVRAKNPLFWVQVVLSIIVPIGAYYGIEAKDVTSWAIVFETIGKALLNPYVVAMILISLYNTVIDFTTHGIGDSKQAMNYIKPKKDFI